LFTQPILQTSTSDTFTAIAILVVAIGLAGLAILILFSKRKI
jgi:LPXTG-motif cell wall-anchored protein